jgi:hypothetical protein
MNILPLLLLIGMVMGALGAEDMKTRCQDQEKLYNALLKGQKGDTSSAADIESTLQGLSHYWDNPDTANYSAIVEITRASQSLMLFGQGRRAHSLLQEMRRRRPEVINSPVYCYQLFFTTLYGKGDRAGARGVLLWMDKEVEERHLSADAPEYIAVTTGWYRALQYSDSDLLRISGLDHQNSLGDAIH